MTTAERREYWEAHPGAPAVHHCGVAPACPAYAELRKQLIDDSDVESDSEVSTSDEAGAEP
eukprot:14505821-Alexandrium_andersonii.AAC.1